VDIDGEGRVGPSPNDSEDASSSTVGSETQGHRAVRLYFTQGDLIDWNELLCFMETSVVLLMNSIRIQIQVRQPFCRSMANLARCAVWFS